MKTGYFSHDRDARTDPKIIRIRRKYGMEGYGIYFAMLEMMYSDSGNQLPYTEEMFETISFDLRTSVDIKAFVDNCIEYGLFESDGKTYWSESMRRRLNEADVRAAAKSEAARKGAQARWEKRRRQQEAKPVEVAQIEAVGTDAEWFRMVKAYEKNLGLFPTGATAEKLADYYGEMGADTMIIAIEYTNKKQPDRPALYLMKVLQKWSEKGIITPEKANATILDFERKTAHRNNQNQGDQPETPAIRGGFY